MQRVHKLKITDGMLFIDNVVDIFYLLGQKVSLGTLLVFPDKAVFFIDSRYIDICKGIDGVEIQLAEAAVVENYIKKAAPSKIYIDEQNLSFLKYKMLQKAAPSAEFTPSAIMNETRAIKDPDEIKKMKVAGSLNHAAFEHAKSLLKVGVTEKEIAWEYEKYGRERGAEGLSFGTIVAFGKGSAYPHYATGDVKLKKGMAVLFDCGVTVDNYTSDMTRSFFFESGANPSDYKLWKTHFDLVKESYDRAFMKAKPGEMFSVLDEQVQAYAKEQKVMDHVKHSLGHGLGLDVHEWPRVSYAQKNIQVKENMIFTIEPGLYFEGKWGIRHENTILMTKNGPEVLSK